MSKSKPITEQTSSKAINAKITAVRKAGQAFNNAVHEAALMIMEHAKAYNDCSGAGRLFDAMPKSNRRALLVRWFEMFSPIVLDKKDGKGHAHFAKEGSKKAIKFNIEGARETPWYDIPEANNEPGFFTYDDAVEAVEKLAKRLDRLARGQGKSEVPEKDKATVAAIAAALNTIKLPSRPAAPVAANNEGENLPVAKVA